MDLSPGDSCWAPPPYIAAEPVEAIFRGPAPPSAVNELGGEEEDIPRVFVEYEDEVYAVDAEAVRPMDAEG